VSSNQHQRPVLTTTHSKLKILKILLLGRGAKPRTFTYATSTVVYSSPDCSRRLGNQNFRLFTRTKGKPVDLLEMSALDALDCEIGGIPSNATDVFGNIAMNGDEYVRCVRCLYGGCDLRVSGCGCTLHSVGDCVFSYESLSTSSTYLF
jgi:hypothetical protein